MLASGTCSNRRSCRQAGSGLSCARNIGETGDCDGEGNTEQAEGKGTDDDVFHCEQTGWGGRISEKLPAFNWRSVFSRGAAMYSAGEARCSLGLAAAE